MGSITVTTKDGKTTYQQSTTVAINVVVKTAQSYDKVKLFIDGSLYDTKLAGENQDDRTYEFSWTTGGTDTKGEGNRLEAQAIASDGSVVLDSRDKSSNGCSITVKGKKEEDDGWQHKDCDWDPSEDWSGGQKNLSTTTAPKGAANFSMVAKNVYTLAMGIEQGLNIGAKSYSVWGTYDEFNLAARFFLNPAWDVGCKYTEIVTAFKKTWVTGYADKVAAEEFEAKLNKSGAFGSMISATTNQVAALGEKVEVVSQVVEANFNEIQTHGQQIEATQQRLSTTQTSVMQNSLSTAVLGVAVNQVNSKVDNVATEVNQCQSRIDGCACAIEEISAIRLIA